MVNLKNVETLLSCQRDELHNGYPASVCGLQRGNKVEDLGILLSVKSRNLAMSALTSSMFVHIYVQTSGREVNTRLAGPGSQWAVAPRIIKLYMQGMQVRVFVIAYNMTFRYTCLCVCLCDMQGPDFDNLKIL